jgi:FMN phosphatase YigB (HAD superfamily)
MAPKVIFIDWDGTLSKSRFWEHWQREDPESYNKIQQAFFVENINMFNDWMRGYISAEQIVSEIVSLTGYDYHHLMAELEKSCRAMVFTHPEVLDAIQAKRRQGIKVVLATNNMDTFDRWTVPSLKLEQYFDDILNSAERGALKEDITEDNRSLFFDHYLSRNAIRPNETLLIDDRDLAKPIQEIGIHFMKVTPSFNVVDALKSL